MDTALLVAHGDMADLFLYILEGIVNALHPAPGMPNASVTPSFRQISIMACDKFILSLPLLTVPINLYSSLADSKIFLSAVLFSSVKDWRGLLT